MAIRTPPPINNRPSTSLIPPSGRRRIRDFATVPALSRQTGIGDTWFRTFTFVGLFNKQTEKQNGALIPFFLACLGGNTLKWSLEQSNDDVRVFMLPYEWAKTAFAALISIRNPYGLIEQVTTSCELSWRGPVWGDNQILKRKKDQNV